MIEKEKVLIIKVGYSETFDREISSTTSYGDVLRTTVLLHAYKDADVTWLVDKKALPILKDIKEINRILILDPMTIVQLQAEHFDTVINLEKVPGLCALADSIKAWRRYGFRFDVRKGEAKAYDGTEEALLLCNDIYNKRINKRYAQDLLYDMIGERWSGEEYIFPYKPKSKVIYDIGFNHAVGKKWPTKAWPMEYWKKLQTLLAPEFSISWQEGLEDMEDYFDWINSCRMIVTNDSFGLHLAVSMKKKVVSLFGPTNPSEVFLYNLGEKIIPFSDCAVLPCYEQTCRHDTHCLKSIHPEVVSEAVKRVWKEKSNTREKDADCKITALNTAG